MLQLRKIILYLLLFITLQRYDDNFETGVIKNCHMLNGIKIDRIMMPGEIARSVIHHTLFIVHCLLSEVTRQNLYVTGHESRRLGVVVIVVDLVDEDGDLSK